MLIVRSVGMERMISCRGTSLAAYMYAEHTIAAPPAAAALRQEQRRQVVHKK
jgi:hypothetical protein